VKEFCRPGEAAHAADDPSHAGGDRSTSLLTARIGCLKSSGMDIGRWRLSRRGKVRLVSRNQNDLTARYPELKDMAKMVKRSKPFSTAKSWRLMTREKPHSA
jgi:hypothetical protein